MSEGSEVHVEKPGPTELRDPLVRQELKRAGVWFGLALAIGAVIFLAEPLLLIFAGGMAVEGFGTWLLLMAGGVPFAALLGLLTGLLAFIPQIGAIVSGVLMILAGFSVSVDAGLWAIAVYLIVQTVDGYLIVPYVARKTVDLAPALVLGAQLLFGALFGLMGLALADPIVAMIKAALQQQSEDDEAGTAAEP